MRTGLVICLVLALSGCIVTPVEPVRTVPAAAPTRNAQVVVDDFVRVAQRMEPTAERICANRSSGVNCDFRIVVDSRKGQPANAYQTVDRNGRPILAFTVALIADVLNQDELAFIMGHEAAHHIVGHLAKTQEQALTGAALGGLLATLAGASPEAVDTAQNIGATVGVRRYSKDFELEADALGTVIAFRAGYDPERGAAYFTRIPDPGDNLLSTHPPNASRMQTVRRTMAGLR